MGYIIEIATSDFQTTRSAVEGGADRIELCANLAEGGTTPSQGMILQCRKTFPIPIYTMIRPRAGDFLYSDEEFEIMLSDVIFCRQAECDGIVTGMLKQDGSIDIKRVDKLIKAAYPLGVTFHRAFDRCQNPFEALELLVESGCERILTSGQQQFAIDGIELIAELNRVGGHRIHIMPGSGVRKNNIKTIAERTGCTEFHASLRGKLRGNMGFIHPAFEGSQESYEMDSINPEEVRALRYALD